MRHPPIRQHGGAIGLLLTLLALGMLAYLLLRPGTPQRPDAASAIGCEQRVAKLVSSTGGVGAEAKSAYDALPSDCRKLLPDPAALAPSAERMPEE